MFKHEKQLFHPIGVERANPQYAALLQEQLGGGNAFMAKASGNNILKKQCLDRAEAYKTKYDEMCDAAGLEKRYNRMATYNPKKVFTNEDDSNIIKEHKGLSAKNNSPLAPDRESPKFIKKIDISKDENIIAELKAFEDRVVDSEIEKACIVTKDGEVWECSGTKDRVHIDALGDITTLRYMIVVVVYYLRQMRRI